LEVSVVIPCFNEEKYIKDCVLSLWNNGFNQQSIELLVVDGGSTDNTLNILKELQEHISGLRIIYNTRKFTPFALNLGVEQSLGKCILIAGAHAEYPECYVQNLYQLIQTEGIDVVGGALETVAGNDSEKAKSIQWVLSHPMGVGNSAFRTGTKELMQVDTVPFGLYKREVFETCGLYNVKLIRNHDMELSKRILSKGYTIWLAPDLKVKYFARSTYVALAKNNYGNGFWNIKTVWITRNLKSLSIRHFVPMAFVLSILIPLLLAVLFHPYWGVLAIASLLSYSLAILSVTLKCSTKQSAFSVLKTFVVLHFSYGFGGLVAFFSLLNPFKR
jgi:glycosyltransferase involved in cell wall biosynthesis